MADLGYDGRVAIITGSGGGLGWEHAKLLAGRGALLVINDLGGTVDGSVDGSGASTLAEQRAEALRALGGEAVASTDSVATVEGGRAIVQAAIDGPGRPHPGAGRRGCQAQHQGERLGAGGPHPGRLTAEEVRNHFEEMRAPEGATIPAGPADELAALLSALG